MGRSDIVCREVHFNIFSSLFHSENTRSSMEIERIIRVASKEIKRSEKMEGSDDLPTSLNRTWEVARVAWPHRSTSVVGVNQRREKDCPEDKHPSKSVATTEESLFFYSIYIPNYINNYIYEEYCISPFSKFLPSSLGKGKAVSDRLNSAAIVCSSSEFNSCTHKLLDIQIYRTTWYSRVSTKRRRQRERVLMFFLQCILFLTLWDRQTAAWFPANLRVVKASMMYTGHFMKEEKREKEGEIPLDRNTKWPWFR